MFEQSEEEQQPCVMCDQHNEQMLMLSCVHDPCIDCAATHYVDNEPHNSPVSTLKSRFTPAPNADRKRSWISPAFRNSKGFTTPSRARSASTIDVILLTLLTHRRTDKKDLLTNIPKAKPMNNLVSSRESETVILKEGGIIRRQRKCAPNRWTTKVAISEGSRNLSLPTIQLERKATNQPTPA